MKKLVKFFSIRNLLIILFILISIGWAAYSFRKTKNFVNYCLLQPGDNILIKEDSKISILVHGFPEPIYKNHALYKYFDERGYSIISPYLFNSDFDLTQEEVLKYIEEKLDGKSPDVIVGVSLGGLIAPYLAKEFPEAKLVLIATGPYVETSITPLNDLLSFLKKTWTLTPVHWIMTRTPTWIYSVLYRLCNSPKDNPKELKNLGNHIKQNWTCLTKIPLSEDREIIDLLAYTDNTLLLRSLKNETIIFTSNGDVLMPSNLSLKMRDLVKRSSFILTENRLHFNIFNEDNYKQLDNFLGVSSYSGD